MKRLNNAVFQLGVYAITVAGYVALAIGGEPTAEFVALTGPVLAAAFLMTHLGQQDRVLGEIQENTNGKLDARIQGAIERALAARDRG